VTRSPLPRLLLAVYVLLIVHASLHPFAGWQAHGGSPFEFVTAPWPRWITAFDVAANVLGYLPFGMLCVLSLRPRLGRGAAATAAVLGGALL
jgi:VanZ family protein